MQLTNNKTGEILVLTETDDIQMLRNQLMLLGMKGLAYNEIWHNICKKIKKLENEN